MRPAAIGMCDGRRNIAISLIDPYVVTVWSECRILGEHKPNAELAIWHVETQLGMRCEEVKMQSESLPFLIWASAVPMHLLPAAPR